MEDKVGKKDDPVIVNIVIVDKIIELGFWLTVVVVTVAAEVELVFLDVDVEVRLVDVNVLGDVIREAPLVVVITGNVSVMKSVEWNTDVTGNRSVEKLV